MRSLLGLTCAVLLSAISLLSIYQWVLAIISIASSRHRKDTSSDERLRFIVLIPAHNEEVGLPKTMRSIEQLQYPKELVRVVVVADRCTDATAVVAMRHGVDCFERSSGEGGKGAAIAWAIQEIKTAQVEFDALVIIDADVVVHPGLLGAFNQGLLTGHGIQQGYNYLSNPWESPFTRIIAVTSVLKNRLFYTGKSRIGLSGLLTGTGMCFSRKIIERYGWTAFSVGEDCEFSVSLLLAGEHIYFNSSAHGLAKESSGMRQASRQRLRWATGRHAVTTSSAWLLIKEGVRRRELCLIEAAATLAAPNYSSQASLAILGLLGSWFLVEDPLWGWLFMWSVVVLGSLGAYFCLGVFFTEAPLRTLAGLPLIPIFLAWRMVIEVLALCGYGRRHWGRSARSSASPQENSH
jgi:1,2-diacylglycerol 3-beta-glucosyltransferase